MSISPLMPCAENDFLADHVMLLLESYQRLTQQSLIDFDETSSITAENLFKAPFVVVSHNRAEDPVFNYGNQMALALFEMSWDEFILLPSRYSAEPLNREERAHLLKTVSMQGFINDYRGVRISKTGRRFFIEQATVWNLIDAQGQCSGQAATFKHWTWL